MNLQLLVSVQNLRQRKKIKEWYLSGVEDGEGPGVGGGERNYGKGFGAGERRVVVGVSVAETERRVRTRDRSQKRRVSENERQRSCHLLYLKALFLVLQVQPKSASPTC